MSLVLYLENNDHLIPLFIRKTDSNGVESEDLLQQQQVLDIGFSVRRQYWTTANWLQAHISSWEKQSNHLVALLL